MSSHGNKTARTLDHTAPASPITKNESYLTSYQRAAGSGSLTGRTSHSVRLRPPRWEPRGRTDRPDSQSDALVSVDGITPQAAHPRPRPWQPLRGANTGTERDVRRLSGGSRGVEEPMTWLGLQAKNLPPLFWHGDRFG